MTKKKFSSLHQGQEVLIFIKAKKKRLSSSSSRPGLHRICFFLLDLQRQFQDDLQLV
jgi:hypothetical protein